MSAVLHGSGWWRWISLEKQLPSVRGMAGIQAPAAICCLFLVAIGALSLFGFGHHEGRAVPGEIVTSQEELVGRLAGGVRASITHTIDSLEAAASGYPSGPGADATARASADRSLVSTIVRDGGNVQSVAVLDAGTRQIVAESGPRIDPAALPAVIKTMTVVPVPVDRNPVLLVALPVSADRLVAAALPLRLRQLSLNSAGEQWVSIATRAGVFCGGQGTADTVRDAATADLMRSVVTRATGAAHRSRATAAVGDDARMPAVTAAVPVTDAERSGSRQRQRQVPVAAAASVGDLGIAVVSVIRVVPTTAASSRGGRWVALGLLVVAGVVFIVLQLAVTRPVNQVLARAKAIAAGDVGAGGRTRVRGAEARRIDLALTTIAASLGADAPRRSGGGARSAGARRRRRDVTAAMVVVAASILIAGCASGVAYRYAFGPVSVPDQITNDTGNITDGVASALRGCFTDGLARLSGQARQASPDGAGSAHAVATSAAAGTHTFRSVYVTDTRGRVLSHSGRQPLRRNGHVPQVDAAVLDRPSGRTPVLYAAVGLPGGRYLVGEFDVHHLIKLMTRSGHRMRVVDQRMRVILDTKGYVAFQQVRDRQLREVAAAAARGEWVAAVARSPGIGTLVAAAAVGKSGTAAPAGFSLISQRDTTTLRLPANEPRNMAWVVACLCCGTALMLGSWYWLMVLGPLRALARSAGALAAGDTGTVITPMRHDEVGSIAICLELCRQVLVAGPERFGGANRYAPPGEGR